MTKRTKWLKAVTLCGALVFGGISRSSYAFFDPVATATLIKILANAIDQLVRLNKIIQTGRAQLDYIRSINRGLHDALDLIRTMPPITDPGLYERWKTVEVGIRELERIYGRIERSSEEQVQRDTDKDVAEVVALNNSVYDYAKDIDRVTEQIKSYSYQVSPGGAQKLTAQSLAVLIQLLNQTLRTHATGLKLQAQSLAVQNHKDKAESRSILQAASTLSNAMRSEKVTFLLPRF